jgi:hypothetical protein
MNKNAGQVTLKTDRFAEILGNKKTATDIIRGDQFVLAEGINIPARSAIILEVK